MEILRSLVSPTLETLYMTFVSLIFSYLLGIPVGIILVGTKKGGIFENKYINMIVGYIVNLVRSIPFLIFMILLMPFTRWLLGTGIGNTAVIIPLTLACIPFVARMTEQSVEEIDKGVIEAAQIMGASKLEIVFQVYLKESIPSLIKGAAITCISIISYTAMAGVVGGGGLGKYAITQGYQQYRTDIILWTVLVLIIIVEIVQISFSLLAKIIDKKK